MSQVPAANLGTQTHLLPEQFAQRQGGGACLLLVTFLGCPAGCCGRRLPRWWAAFGALGLPGRRVSFV